MVLFCSIHTIFEFTSFLSNQPNSESVQTKKEINSINLKGNPINGSAVASLSSQRGARGMDA